MKLTSSPYKIVFISLSDSSAKPCKKINCFLPFITNDITVELLVTLVDNTALISESNVDSPLRQLLPLSVYVLHPLHLSLSKNLLIIQ